MKKQFLYRRIEDATQETLNPPAGVHRPNELPSLDTMVGARVVSKDGEDIGTVECFWEDPAKQAQFIGVKTGWLGLGSIHVVPADGARYSPSPNAIRIPYSKETVKDAPSYEADQEISETRQREIWNYYGMRQESTTTRRTTETREAPPRLSKQATGEEVRVPLHEETMEVGKREVEVGGVRLRKIVRVETIQQPVELRREELVVERGTSPSGAPSSEAHAFEEEEFYIPLRREEAVVKKEVRKTGEVRARKEAATERQTVSGQVRKEDVQTEKREK